MIGIIGTIAVETASSFKPVREAYYLYSPDPEVAEGLYQQNKTPAWNWYNNTARHAAYEGGPEYHGRGFVQLTHKSTYSRAGQAIGIDLVNNPDLVLDAKVAAETLMWYWQDRGISGWAENQDWLGVRKAVFGGTDQNGANRMARINSTLP